MNLYCLEGKHPQFSAYSNIHPYRLDCAKGWSPDRLAGTTARPSDRQFLLQWQAINWFCWKELCVEGKWWEGGKNWGFYFLHIIKENWGTKKAICQKTPTTDLHLRLGWKDLLKLQSGTYSQGHPLFPCALQRLCRTEQPYAHQNRVPAHWQRQLPNTTAVK